MNEPLSNIAFALKSKAAVEKLREALAYADAAINPPDRDGISLHTWNERLKSATETVRQAIALADRYLR